MGTNTRWDRINKSTTLFPAFSPAIVPDMETETEKFFDNVVFARQGTFQDSAAQPDGVREHGDGAALRARPPPGSTPTSRRRRWTRPSGPGFLTRVGFLNAYAFYNRTSPIHRGAFITKQVLGVPIAAPAARRGRDTPLPTRRRSRHQPQAGGRADVRRCLRSPATTATSTRPASRWRRSTPSAPGRRRRRPSVDGRRIDTTADVMIDGGARPRHGTRRPDGGSSRPRRMAQHRYAERWVVVRLRARWRPDGLLHGQQPQHQDRRPAATPSSTSSPISPSHRRSEPAPSRRPNEPQSLSQGCWRRRPGRAVPELVCTRRTAKGARRRRRRPSAWSSSTPTTGASRTAGSRRSKTARSPPTRWRARRSQPLTPYVTKLLVPRGFRSMNEYGTGQTIDPHDQAMGSKLTCATIDRRHEAVRDGRPRSTT